MKASQETPKDLARDHPKDPTEHPDPGTQRCKTRPQAGRHMKALESQLKKEPE